MSDRTTGQRSAKKPITIVVTSADGKFATLENTERKNNGKWRMMRSSTVVSRATRANFCRLNHQLNTELEVNFTDIPVDYTHSHRWVAGLKKQKKRGQTKPTTMPKEPTTTPKEPTTMPKEPTTMPKEPTTTPEFSTTTNILRMAGNNDSSATTIHMDHGRAMFTPRSSRWNNNRREVWPEEIHKSSPPPVRGEGGRVAAAGALVVIAGLAAGVPPVGGGGLVAAPPIVIAGLAAGVPPVGGVGRSPPPRSSSPDRLQASHRSSKNPSRNTFGNDCVGENEERLELYRGNQNATMQVYIYGSCNVGNLVGDIVPVNSQVDGNGIGQLPKHPRTKATDVRSIIQDLKT